MTAQTMNAYVKTSFSLAQVHPGIDSSRAGVTLESKDARVLKQVKSLHIQRNLLNANKSSQMFIGVQSTETEDPNGCVLRKLRIQQGLDPSVVASHACISVWQLYELETGKNTLFYTPGLRTRAAERVASFLNSNWTDICEGRVSVKTLQETPAQLHLIGSRRHEPRIIRPLTAQSTPEPIQTVEVAEGPLSLTQLLRVADASSRPTSA
jgi:hypothetical protein